MNFARLNHILIPTTAEERERLRGTKLLRLMTPLSWYYYALSDEGRIITIMMLFIGTAGLEVASTEVYVLWAALVGVLLAAIAVRPLFKLADVRVSVHAPPRISVGAVTTFTLRLHNGGDRDRLAVRIRGPFLPWDGTWQGTQPRVGRIEPGETVHCESRATFAQRGHHHLDPFKAVSVVPLGLSVGPSIRTGSCHFTVVPRIAPISRLTLPMGRSYQPGGVAHASQTGEAMELMGVRPYRPGDPVRDLHPKTWARVGTPHVREYQQEYFTRIGVIVDNAKGTITEEGFEATISLAAGVVGKLTGGEALIDLLVMGGDIHAMTIGRSLGGLDQALDVLANAAPEDPIAPQELMARLDPYLARLSCIIIVTQSMDKSRLELADAIGRRGIAVRMLRVHDDSGAFLRRRPVQPPGSEFERVITVSRINESEPLVL